MALESAPAFNSVKCKWMYADFGWRQKIAYKDPLRWSHQLTLDELIQDLDAEENARKRVICRKDVDDKSRPIIVRRTEGMPPEETFETRAQLTRWMRRSAPSTHDLRPDLSINAAWCAMRAYDDHEANEEKKKELADVYEKQNVHFTFWEARKHKECTTIYAIGCINNTMFVSFRGSVTILDFVQDLSCTIRKNSVFDDYGVCVHQAFLTQIEFVYEPIIRQMARCAKQQVKEQREVTQLVITGHSLGGGLAVCLRAFLWHLLECEKWGKVPEAEGLTDLVRNARCITFAGPSVFAVHVDEAEEDCELVVLTDEQKRQQQRFNDFMKQNVVNYIFHDDPVPRAYQDLDAHELFQVIGQEAMAYVRFFGRIGQGAVAVGAVAGMAAFAFAGVGLVATGLAVGAGGVVGGGAEVINYKAFNMSKSQIDDSVQQFNHFAKRYRMVGEVRVLRDTEAPWHHFQLSPAALGHHSVTGYVRSVQDRVPGGHYTKKSSGLFAITNLAPAESDEDLREKALELFAQLMRNENPKEAWAEVLSVFSRRKRGWIESIELDDWHFVHVAASHGNAEVFQELMGLGADPLRVTVKDRATVADVARASPTCKDKERAEFDAVVATLKAMREAGADMAVFDAEVIFRVALPLDAHEDREKKEEAKRAMLIRIGFSIDDVEKLCKEGAGIVEDLTRLRGGASNAILMEQQHSFLDAAKYSDWGVLREKIKKFPGLVLSGPALPEPRWAAIQQVAYCGAPKWIAVELLCNYPDKSELSNVQAQMDKVDRKVKEEEEEDKKAAADAAAVGGGPPSEIVGVAPASPQSTGDQGYPPAAIPTRKSTRGMRPQRSQGSADVPHTDSTSTIGASPSAASPASLPKGESQWSVASGTPARRGRGATVATPTFTGDSKATAEPPQGSQGQSPSKAPAGTMAPASAAAGDPHVVDTAEIRRLLEKAMPLAESGDIKKAVRQAAESLKWPRALNPPN